MKISSVKDFGKSGYYVIRFAWRKQENDVVYWNDKCKLIKVLGGFKTPERKDIVEVFGILVI